MEKQTILRIFYSLTAVICLVLILCIAKECTGDNNSDDSDLAKWKIERAQLLDRTAEKQRLNDSLKLIVAGYVKSDSIKSITIAAKESEITRLRGQISNRKKEAAKDYPKFFSDRYELPISITPDPASALIADDLIEGDIAKEELNFTQGILEIERSRIAGKDVIIGTQGQIITNLEAAVKDFETAIEKTDDIISKQESDIKKQRRAKNTWKVISGMALIGGFILGTQ